MPAPPELPDWAPPDYNPGETINTLLDGVRNFRGDPNFADKLRQRVINPRWLPPRRNTGAWFEDMMAEKPTRTGVPLASPALDDYPDDLTEDPYLYLSRLYGFPEVEE